MSPVDYPITICHYRKDISVPVACDLSNKTEVSKVDLSKKTLEEEAADLPYKAVEEYKEDA